MLPRSPVCAGMYMTWQVPELQVMSGMQRCCVMLLWNQFVCLVLLWWPWSAPLHGSWEKVKMVASARSLHSLNSQKIPLINYWSKPLQSSAKKSQVCSDSRRPCVWECVSVGVAEGENGGKWGAYRWGEKKRWRNKGTSKGKKEVRHVFIWPPRQKWDIFELF